MGCSLVSRGPLNPVLTSPPSYLPPSFLPTSPLPLPTSGTLRSPFSYIFLLFLIHLSFYLDLYQLPPATSLICYYSFSSYSSSTSSCFMVIGVYVCIQKLVFA